MRGHKSSLHVASRPAEHDRLLTDGRCLSTSLRFVKDPWSVFHHPLSQDSWMNRMMQRFGILAWKRLGVTDFPSKEHLAERLMIIIREWHEIAHSSIWTSKPVAKVMAQCQDEPTAGARPSRKKVARAMAKCHGEGRSQRQRPRRPSDPSLQGLIISDPKRCGRRMQECRFSSEKA
jgi:hypothetical protein